MKPDEEIEVEKDSKEKYVLIPGCYLDMNLTLKRRGRKKILTFKESIEAIVDNFNTIYDENGHKRSIEERTKLIYRTWHGTPNLTSTFVLYKHLNFSYGHEAVKIVPRVPMNIIKKLFRDNRNRQQQKSLAAGFGKDFWGAFAEIEGRIINGNLYDRLDGEEVFKLKDGESLNDAEIRYDNLIDNVSYEKTKNHPIWLAMAEGDSALIKEYSNIMSKAFNESSAVTRFSRFDRLYNPRGVRINPLSFDETGIDASEPGLGRDVWQGFFIGIRKNKNHEKI